MYSPEFLNNFDWLHNNEGYPLLLQKELYDGAPQPVGRATIINMHLNPRSGACILFALERFVARSTLSFSR